MFIPPQVKRAAGKDRGDLAWRQVVPRPKGESAGQLDLLAAFELAANIMRDAQAEISLRRGGVLA